MLDKIAAVIYVITFGFAYYRMFVLPKGNRKLNGVTWILLRLLLEVSGQGHSRPVLSMHFMLRSICGPCLRSIL